MNWWSLARLEGERLLRNRWTWMFGVLAAASVNRAFGLRPQSVAVPDALVVAGAFQQGLVALVAVASILAAYQSVASERNSGALKTHLAMPQSRFELLIGKLVGRATALISILTLVFGVGLGLGYLDAGAAPVVPIVGLWLLTVVHVFAGVSIGIAISVVAPSTRVATTLMTVSLLVLLLWSSVFAPIVTTILGSIAPGTHPTVYFLTRRLSPTGSYNVVSNALLGVGNSAGPWMQVVVAQSPVQTNLRLVSQTMDSPPLVLHPFVSLFVLIGWTLVSLGVSRWWFSRDDVVTSGRR